MNARQEQSGGTLGKAMEILDLVAARQRPARFSDLMAESRFPKTTLYRTLQNLTRLGLLAYDEESQTYRPGLRLLGLAHATWRQATLAPVAKPVIDELARDIGEVIHLAQIEKGQVLYVDKRNKNEPMDMFSATGKVGPAYCTGIGKVMLAFLPPELAERAIMQQSFFRYTPATLTSAKALRAELKKIRARGIAFDHEEHEPGIICIAAPILSREHLIGGLSITSTSARRSFESLREFGQRLVDDANRIGKLAADTQFPSTL